MPVLSETTGSQWLPYKEINQFKWNGSDSHSAENEMLQSTLQLCKKKSLWKVNSCNLSFLYNPQRKIPCHRNNTPTAVQSLFTATLYGVAQTTSFQHHSFID